MANYTTLAAACLVNDQILTLTSATGQAIGNVIIVDGEQMVQSGALIGTVQIPVQRGGKGGTVQSSHPILSGVVMGTAQEIQGTAPTTATTLLPSKQVIVSYGASGAITPPNVDTLIFLDKATAAAMTLVSPTAGTPDGVRVTVFSTTAAAHTVTYTAGFNADTTASDVATFAATSGNSFTFMSYRGLWGMIGASGVTLG